MSFDSKILGRVLAARRMRAIKRETRTTEIRNEIFERLPRAADIDTELKTSAIEVARAAIADGADPTAGIEKLKARTILLRSELTALLTKNGYLSTAMEPGYECARCRDSGYLSSGVLSSPCNCLIEEYAEAQLDRLSETLPVRRQNFDSFDAGVFSAAVDPSLGISCREYMTAAMDTCREFAANDEGSLLIYGAAGTGKTFLASCVAADMSTRGRSVIYGTAAEVFALYEKAKFTYDADVQMEVGAEIERMLKCDLLIVDDLGAEFKSAFAATALMSLLDSRLRRGRRMLIIAAIDMKTEVAARYTPQIVSRLRGEFEQLPLFGEDLRSNN